MSSKFNKVDARSIVYDGINDTNVATVLNELNKYPSHIDGGTFTKKDLEESLIKIEQDITYHQDRKNRLSEILDIVKSLQFQEGDVAFHRNFGNILIKGAHLNIDERKETAVNYSIITSKGIIQVVPLDSIVPISEATKILFGKE